MTIIIPRFIEKGDNISKVELPSKEVLSHYFMEYRPQWDVILTKYDQIKVDRSIAEVDPTEIVNRYTHYINMFLGANCSNSNILDFDAVKWLFLSGRQYSKDNLKKLNIGFDFADVPNIDLSNNDFGKYNFVWDFGEFLNQIYHNVYSYVYPSFSHDFTEAITEDEEEFDTYGVFHGYSSAYVTRKMEEIIKPIMTKLIPNVKNTNIKILINLRNIGLNCLYELIEDILKNGFFDGCYIKVVDCCHDFSKKMGLSENDFEFYQYSPNVSRKRKKS